MATNPCVMVQDDDCHWYLIEEADLEAFRVWVEDPYGDLIHPKSFQDRTIGSPRYIRILDWEVIE